MTCMTNVTRRNNQIHPNTYITVIQPYTHPVWQANENIAPTISPELWERAHGDSFHNLLQTSAFTAIKLKKDADVTNLTYSTSSGIGVYYGTKRQTVIQSLNLAE